METIITARHCEISDTLRERASTLVERLEALAPREVEATIVFDVEGTAGTTRVVRLRVDGVDSVPVDPAAPGPQSYDPHQMVKFT